MKSLARLVSLLLFCAAPALADPASRADQIIAAAKQAAGGAAWDRLSGLQIQGDLSSGGLAGRSETWVDLKTLHEASMFNLGPASGEQGWDGRTAWSVDASGDLRLETSPESVATAIQGAYRAGFAFFLPDRFPAKRIYLGERAVDGKVYDAVEITPGGASPFEVWVDPATHLVAREVQVGGSEPHSFIFADWRYVGGGVRLPYTTIDRAGADARFDQVFTARLADASGQTETSRFAPPHPVVSAAVWPAHKSEVSVPFRLLNNHIYVAASIDGASPQSFIFDTGATDILDLGHAKALGIAVAGSLPVGGFGDKFSGEGLAKVESISIGGLALRDQVFGAIDLAWLPAIEGADSAGLFGYEFAKRAVIRIDYADRRLTFIRPDQFRPPDDAQPIPFRFHEHTLIVDGDIDGVPGQFEIDTGSRAALTVMGPFAEAHGLIQKYRAHRLATVNYGIGGPSRALLARVGALSIGTVVIKAPVTAFATAKGGDAASTYVAGNIGGDLLKRFTVTLDYGRQRLWLQPNASSALADVFDRSGLWISRTPDGEILVDDVDAGSAAAAAGITVGDEIVAVDGEPASGIQLFDLRESLKAAPGVRIAFTLRRAGSDRTVTLVLADQV